MSHTDLQDRDRADMGIFPLLVISNFERGPNFDLFFTSESTDARVALLW